MKKRFKKGFAQFLSMMLVAIVTAGIVPQTAGTVKAAADKTITGLGTGAIANPTPGAGGWSYVYYGTYNGSNVKYRVLDTYATEFNSNPTMFLDCDIVLLTMMADSNYDWTDESNYSGYTWGNSTLCDWLNGSNFYGNSGVFTDSERSAVVASIKTDFSNDGQGRPDYLPQNLTGEHVFLLDVKEAQRSDYGFQNEFSTNSTRVKTYNGVVREWWLRSQVEAGVQGAGDLCTDAPMAHVDGRLVYRQVDNEYGVSPAFNVDLSSVIFSSLISGTSGASGAEYKLTLKDSDMSIAVTDGSSVSREGAVVTVPYTISGSNAGNATQVSVVIKDGAWNLGTSATSGYTYLKLDVESFGTSGTGTFTMPEEYADKTLGTDYFVYILAEDVSGGNATDYASAPVPITIPAISRGSSNTPASNPSNGGGNDPASNPSNGGNSNPASITSNGGNNDPASNPSNGGHSDPASNSSNGGNNTPAPSSNGSVDSSSVDSSVDSHKEYGEPDFYDDLRILIRIAIERGGEQTIHYSKGNKLPYDIMMTLEENPQITVVYKYSYMGTDYKATIGRGKVKTEIGIYWYGPLYLNEHFGEWSLGMPPIE